VQQGCLRGVGVSQVSCCRWGLRAGCCGGGGEEGGGVRCFVGVNLSSSVIGRAEGERGEREREGEKEERRRRRGGGRERERERRCCREAGNKDRNGDGLSVMICLCPTRA